MQSVKRYDPNAVQDVSAAPSSGPDDGLAALRARLEQRKRKRHADDEGIPAPASKTVTFSEVVHEQSAPALPSASTSQPPAPATAKTKAKQRYLKNKKTRYKANQKALPKEQRARATSVTGEAGEPTGEVDVEAERAARRERKLAIRAARHTTSNNEPAVEAILDAIATGNTHPLERLKGRRATSDDDHGVDEAAPTEGRGLERFPKPRKLVAPDRALLRELGVADELRDGVQIEPTLTVELSELTSRTSEEPLISATMRQKLVNAEISTFFAVQAAVLPLLLEPRQLYPPPEAMPDLCVSAPTGSGKTLAYVLPIIETLSARIVTRLRALVVLPTRDLAEQVRETFVAFCQGTGLKVGSAGCSQHTFAREQELLTSADGSLHAGGLSNIDILVATPGRLLDHLKSTPNFTLHHLRFFVIDEADRLVGQSFNEWLPIVLEHLEATSIPTTASPSPVAPHLVDSLLPVAETLLDPPQGPTVQKLLFSATLSRDPAQIAGLRLNRPIYVAVRDAGADELGDEAFTLPPTLKEHILNSAPASKPLLLFHLLLDLHVAHALCFTKSIEAATRLVKLVELFLAAQVRLHPTDAPALRVASYSSDLPVAKRTKLLEAFKSGDIHLLVCSDLIARGMDLPHVEHVISYDVPVDMRKYVHRVGRTARAGRDGQAWSLVESQEMARFREMLKVAGRADKVVRERVKKADLQRLQPAYEEALEGLKRHYASR